MVLERKKRNTDQRNRIESPEIKSHTNGELICDKGGKTIQWRKDNLFKKWCWENWMCKYVINEFRTLFNIIHK